MEAWGGQVGREGVGPPGFWDKLRRGWARLLGCPRRWGVAATRPMGGYRGVRVGEASHPGPPRWAAGKGMSEQDARMAAMQEQLERLTATIAGLTGAPAAPTAGAVGPAAAGVGPMAPAVGPPAAAAAEAGVAPPLPGPVGPPPGGGEATGAGGQGGRGEIRGRRAARIDGVGAPRLEPRRPGTGR